MSKSSTARLTASRKSPRPDAAPALVPPGFEALAYVFQCGYGHYPWDDWKKAALAAGVSEDLAGVGRLTMREAFQHDWSEGLKGQCGWSDQGQGMIKLALRSPRKARRQWNILLRTDGLRGDYPPSPKLRRPGRARSIEWVWGYLRSDARRLLAMLNP